MGAHQFNWDRTMDTGIEEMDVQHRRVTQLLNHIVERNEAEAQAAIDELRRHLRVHYACEEALLEHYCDCDLNT
nr:hypothetical protein [Planctomycetota bacterium]